MAKKSVGWLLLVLFLALTGLSSAEYRDDISFTVPGGDGDGLYVSSRLVCYHDDRADNRVLDAVDRYFPQIAAMPPSRHDKSIKTVYTTYTFYYNDLTCDEVTGLCHDPLNSLYYRFNNYMTVTEVLTEEGNPLTIHQAYCTQALEGNPSECAIITKVTVYPANPNTQWYCQDPGISCEGCQVAQFTAKFSEECYVFEEKPRLEGTLSCENDFIYNLTFPIDWTSPKNLKYEGVHSDGPGCWIVSRSNYVDADPPAPPANAQVRGEAVRVSVAPELAYAAIIDWDRNATMCQGLGGDWLSESDAATLGVTAGNFAGFRCCGDDYIYINNRALDYKPMISVIELNQRLANNNVCLYDVNDVYKETNQGRTIVTSYQCQPSAEGSEGGLNEGLTHAAYDTALQLDDEDEAMFAAKERGWYFVGSQTIPQLGQETDIGKWTGTESSQSLYCGHVFVNQTGRGDEFHWMTIKQAADSEQLVCALHLGYNWTGTQCCGDEASETYNDIVPECKAIDISNYLLGLGLETTQGMTFSSRLFEKEFRKSCSQNLNGNGACYLGQFVEHRSAVPSNPAMPGRKDILGSNGTMHGCIRRDGSSPITSPANANLLSSGSQNHPKCTFLADNVCSYHNDSWVLFDQTVGSVGHDILGARNDRRVNESALPFNQTNRECCFSGSCWNGNICVSELSLYVYNSTMRTFLPLSENQKKAADALDVYACVNSRWTEADPKYNWFRDERKVNFCSNPYSCLCSQSQLGTMDDSCPGASDANGCTKAVDYYKDDHLCEAEYSGAEIAGSRWTSRTKLVALQLASLAGYSDFRLYCDKYQMSVNYPLPLEQIAEDINSVCTIHFDGKTAIGIALNPSSGTADKMRDVLYMAGTGIISDVLDEEATVGNCNRAIDATQAGRHGSYVRCWQGSDKIYYNNRTKSFIYSKEGLSLSDPLPEPDWEQAESLLDQEMAPIISHVNANINTIESGINALPDMGRIRYSTDYDRLYWENRGSKSVFGILETKFSDFSQDSREFMGVSYTGVGSLDCEDITTAFDRFYCGTENGRLIVLYKDVVEPEYWRDLTAKIRLT